MTHSDVRNRLSGYLDGDLPLPQRALLDSHLDGCGDCREVLADLRLTVDLLHEFADAEPERGIADAVMQRLRAGEGQPTPWSRFLDGLGALIQPRMLRPLALAAVGAVCFVALRPEARTALERGMAPFVASSAAPAARFESLESALERSGPYLGADDFDREHDRELERARAFAWHQHFAPPRTLDLHADLATRHLPAILGAAGLREPWPRPGPIDATPVSSQLELAR